MQRVPEPELMTDSEQVEAYARADFEQPHQRFIELLGARWPGLAAGGTALDLGCGPGDIACRFARAYPGWHVHGLDGSRPMLDLGRRAIREAGLATRVELACCHLPDGEAPLAKYDLVYSNSLLHHLADPGVLWRSIQRWSAPGAPVFVMDLLRPETLLEVDRLVEEYSRGEPEVLRRDFRNSLCAAYRLEEARLQLEQAGLAGLKLEVVSDRHMLVWG
jgi:ubiquinone/menaquinone biosynthesis C-methylase UbiE